MWLKKYTAVFKTSLKEATAYRFDALSSSFFSFMKVYLAYLLWTAIFGEKEMIGDYTFPMMLTYYILITFMIRMAKSDGIIWETSEEVRSGTFTKYITRPVHHFSFCLSRSAGKSVFALMVDSIAFALWIFIFRKSFYLPGDPMALVYTLGFTLLGLFTYMQVHYMIALISFKTVDIAGPYFFVTNFTSFMAGEFIPLMLLPQAVQKILSFTPFYYILYYPASLYLEQGREDMGKALAVIIIWNIVFFVIRSFQYKRMIKLYEGVGA
jgi:ABC-2 type transport system permease protein